MMEKIILSAWLIAFLVFDVTRYLRNRPNPLSLLDDDVPELGRLQMSKVYEEQHIGEDLLNEEREKPWKQSR